MKHFAAALAAILLAVMLPSCGAQTDDADSITVVATIFPAFDFAREVAGDRAAVVMLLPPGAEPHGYEPTPSDIARVDGAALVIYNGGTSDEWVRGILDAADGVASLAMMDCVTLAGEHEDEADEHVWTSPGNARAIVEAIRDALIELDADGADEYRRNAEAYMLKLDALDAKLREATAGGGTLVFGGRFPFIYLAEEYGFDWHAAFAGCAEESEPSARTLAALIDEARALGARSVFYCDTAEKAYADTIVSGAGVAEAVRLHSCHSVTRRELDDGATYIGLMTLNAERIKEALQ